MFYKMIENKCREWYASDQCTVKSLIDYIEKTGQIPHRLQRKRSDTLTEYIMRKVCWLI